MRPGERSGFVQTPVVCEDFTLHSDVTESAQIHRLIRTRQIQASIRLETTDALYSIKDFLYRQMRSGDRSFETECRYNAACEELVRRGEVE